MATNPEELPIEVPPPDIIEPLSPPEAPPGGLPEETPWREPPGFVPPRPDHDVPDPGIPETPSPSDQADRRAGGAASSSR